MFGEDRRKYPNGKLVYVERPAPVHLQEWMDFLRRSPAFYRASAKTATERQWNSTYREGSWTAKQVMHHVCDSHMMGLYRMKQALTEDNSVFVGYSRDAWVNLSDYHLDPNLSIEMLDVVHQKMVALLEKATDEQLFRTSERDGVGKQTLLNLAQLYSWHALHHLEHVRMAFGLRS